MPGRSVPRTEITTFVMKYSSPLGVQGSVRVQEDASVIAHKSQYSPGCCPNPFSLGLKRLFSSLRPAASKKAHPSFPLVVGVSRLLPPDLPTEGWGNSLNEGLQPLPLTISAQLLKALEAEEKRISPSRDFHCIEKPQTRALPFSKTLFTFFNCYFKWLTRMRTLRSFDNSRARSRRCQNSPARRLKQLRASQPLRQDILAKSFNARAKKFWFGQQRVRKGNGFFSISS